MDKTQTNFGFRSRFLIAQNVIGALLSVPVLVTGILIARTIRGKGEDCATFMHKPIIIVGALLLIVSISGLVAAVVDKLSRAAVLAWLHLLLMFCLVILLFCFAIFSLEITNNGLAHNVISNGQSYKEYRLYEYPKWMRHKVEDENYWKGIKQCLQNASVCGPDYLPFPFSNITYTSLDKLTPIQRGCCIPPSACNITYLGVSNEVEKTTTKDNVEETLSASARALETRQENVKGFQPSTTLAILAGGLNITRQDNDHETARNKTLEVLKTTLDASFNTTKRGTSQKVMSTTLHAYTHDCNKWAYVPDKLCFDCDTCRAGIIQASMDKWKSAGILYVVLVMVMIFSYALFACYGFGEK